METAALGRLRGVIGRAASLIEPAGQGELVGEHQLGELVECLCVVLGKQIVFVISASCRDDGYV